MNTPLSPAAQAVLDAVKRNLDWDANYHADEAAAAALRAAADQVVPRESMKDELWASGASQQRAAIRAHLLAIAAELKGQP